MVLRTDGERGARLVDLLHLVPCLAFIVSFWPAPAGEATATIHVSLLEASWPFVAWLLMSVPAYIAAGLVQLRRYRRRLEDRYSTMDAINLRWASWLLLALAAVWALLIAQALLALVGGRPAGSLHLVFVALSLFVYGLGIQAFRQGPMRGVLLPVETEAPANPAPGRKYERTGLDASEVAATLERLQAHLDDEQPWRESELTLPELAEALDVSTHHLSQAINEGLGKTFFDLINEQRIAAVCAALADPDSEGRTVLELALDCGFGSKSSFNRLFKAATGETPGAYRKRVARRRDNPDLDL